MSASRADKIRDRGGIVVACDGSALSNPGPGGWAWFVDEDTWGADGVGHATNNAMELTAVLRFLDAIDTADVAIDTPVLIRCDSQYVIKGLTEWYPGWVRRDWHNAAGAPVANAELFRAIKVLLESRPAAGFEWVRGHAGDAMNTAVDARANAAATAIRAGRDVRTGPGYRL